MRQPSLSPIARALATAALFAAAMAALPPAATAQQAAPDAAGATGARLVSWRGEVQLLTPAGAATPARDAAWPAATLRTGASGAAQIVMPDGTLIAVGADSELSWADATGRVVRLGAGSLRMDATPAPRGWRVDLGDRSVLTNGWLRLVPCGEGCALQPGLYGRVSQGEAVLEYQGGRSVLRNRSFRWTGAAVRPETLPITPALLDARADQAEAARVRASMAETLRAGLEAFKDGRYDESRAKLEEVRSVVPGETLVTYYLGLIALEQKDNDAALRLLQQYSREDPEGAASREVPKTLTLLASSQLQQEVSSALAREADVVAAPPEPGSIAVHAFVTRDGEAYRAMAKGLAAMIIADLGKVPGLKVLEREKVQVLLDEMKLGDAGLADPASAVRSGRLMRAEKVIVGNFEVQ
jgi:tetratricopeptide (TPR) repeat protein